MENALECSALFSSQVTSDVLDFVLSYTYPWELLCDIGDFILRYGKELCKKEFYSPKDGVWISKRADVAASALIDAPSIIMEGAHIRHCAYIRGSAFVSKNCTVGNSTELKNCILLDGAQAPHFNYVGDSVLGHLAHLGAGAVCSNLKSDKSKITVTVGTSRIMTELYKFGAILGDGAEVGCGAVLNPGTVIGKDSVVYPLSSVRGFVPSGVIFKGSKMIKKH